MTNLPSTALVQYPPAICDENGRLLSQDIFDARLATVSGMLLAIAIEGYNEETDGRTVREMFYFLDAYARMKMQRSLQDETADDS